MYFGCLDFVSGRLRPYVRPSVRPSAPVRPSARPPIRLSGSPPRPKFQCWDLRPPRPNKTKNKISFPTLKFRVRGENCAKCVRDSGCTDKYGERESAGQRGTAQDSGYTEENVAQENAGQSAGQRGTARDSGCTDRNEAREPHPVWGFKYIKTWGVGVSGLRWPDS